MSGELLASLLQASVSHDSEIILIRRCADEETFIIIMVKKDVLINII